MQLSGSYFETRWWEICQRMLTVTLTDNVYHDLCVQWMVNDTIDGDHTSWTDDTYGCNAFGMNMIITFSHHPDETSYLWYLYDFSLDPTYEGDIPVKVKKPYYIDIYVYASFCPNDDPIPNKKTYRISTLELELDKTPSEECNVPDLVRQLKEQAKAYPDLFERASTHHGFSSKHYSTFTYG